MVSSPAHARGHHAMRELILGGVRSGKSRYAEQRARELGGSVYYLATAQSGDDPAMAERIAAHQAHRPADWQTVEVPVTLAAAIAEHDAPGRVLLVDCLTLWLTNLLLTEEPAPGGPDRIAEQREQLLDVVTAAQGHLLLVSNETGLGIMPMNALARRFCDEAGALHQRLAECCEHVTWTVAGLAQPLK